MFYTKSLKFVPITRLVTSVTSVFKTTLVVNPLLIDEVPSIETYNFNFTATLTLILTLTDFTKP